jgi:hypothetical protein
MKKLIYFLYKTSLLLLFLASMHSWFTWNIKTHYIGLVVTFISLIFIWIYRIKLRLTGALLLGGILLIVSGTLGLNFENSQGLLGPVFLVIPCYFLFLINDDKILNDIFQFITNFFTLLLPISLLTFWGAQMEFVPSFGKISYPGIASYPDYNNYILSIVSSTDNFRFSSIFLEPGHLGMILSFLLFALRFNFKSTKVKVILISALFTFSLAAYVLIFLGFILSLFVNGKLQLKYLIIVLITMSVIYMGAQNYNDGNNPLNNLIIERLKFDEEKGISGNNRIYGVTDEYFNDLVTSSDFWWGIGIEEYRYLMETLPFGGAGWKVYILQNGFLSLLLVSIAYFIIGISVGNDRKYTIAFIIILFFAFIQRAYPLWASWLIPFALGIRLYRKK